MRETKRWGEQPRERPIGLIGALVSSTQESRSADRKKQVTLLCQRKDDREGGAVAGGAVHFDGPVVDLGDPLADREPQARAGSEGFDPAFFPKGSLSDLW